MTETFVQLINERNEVNTLDLAEEFNFDHQIIYKMMKNFEKFDDVIIFTPVNKKIFKCTKEGDEIIENGSTETIVYNNIPDTGIEYRELMVRLNNVKNAKSGFIKAISLGWIFVNNTGGKRVVKRKTDTINESVQQFLQQNKHSNSLQVLNKNPFK